MWPNALLSAGYFFLGLLTGYISGISESEISKIILGTLLAFFGGKLFFEIQKKDDTVKKNIGAVIIGFSIAFLISFNVGIYVKVNRVFTPAKYRDSAIWHDVQKNNPYVRSFTAPVDSSKK